MNCDMRGGLTGFGGDSEVPFSGQQTRYHKSATGEVNMYLEVHDIRVLGPERDVSGGFEE